MDMKKVFDSIYSISIPKNAKFITDNLIEATFDSPYNALNDTTTTVSIIDTKNLEQYPILIHNDSESLTGYSSSGDIKAVLRQIPHQKLMPSSVPKFKEKVTILEIIKGQRIIMRKILDENYCNFTKHKTISNEIVFSPDDKKICFTVSDKIDLEKESILGYKVKMYQYKDLGEDLSEIYHTSLAVYDIQKNEIKKISLPDEYIVCKGLWASKDILIIQGIDYSQPKVLGIRSYTNRQFTLFAVNINNLNDIKKIMNPKQTYFDIFKINDELCKICTFEFPEKFPAHNGPLFPKCFYLNLKNYEITNLTQSNQEFFVQYPPNKLFLDENHIVFSEAYHGFCQGTILNLNDFSKTAISGSECCQILDIKNNKIFVLKSTPSSIPRLCIIENGKETYLSEKYDYGLEYEHKYIGEIEDYCNILILKSKNSKKFILLPHGGPHGMTDNGYNKRALIFALCGYNVVHINYIGSTGTSMNSIKKIFGNCGKADLSTVVQTAEYIHKTYSPDLVGIWGFSHGGFLSAHMAAKFSSLIDFAVTGAPVINFISSYYSCDIPDWSLNEALGVWDWKGEKKMDKETFDKMWDMSPIKYAEGINVPILIIHGSEDRRVPLGQSVELYTELKRMGKKVKFYQYDNNGHSFKQISGLDDMIAVSLEFFENFKKEEYYEDKKDNIK
jgi:acylaminoacyl-peptidase